MTYKEIPDAWQTKAQMFLPFPLFWIVISILLLGLAYLVLNYVEESLDNFILISLELVVFATLANGAVYLELLIDDISDSFPKLLNQDINETHEWTESWYNYIFRSKRNIYLGLIFSALFISLGISVIPEIFTKFLSEFLGFFILGLLGFLTGSLVWYMYSVAKMFLSFGNSVKINPSIFDTTTSPLRIASSILWKISIFSTIIYFVGISIYPILEKKIIYWQFVVNILGGIGLILYFIIPQVNIHKYLKKLKESKLSDLVKQIDIAFENVTNDPSMNNINQLRELFYLQQVVDKKNDWSFGFKELLTLVGTIIIPIIVILLKYNE